MSLLKSLNERNTEAREHYRQAGNLFKKCKKFAEAGECFLRCGEISDQLKDKISNDYEECAHCYGQVDTKKQMQVYTKLISMYENNSNFSGAGKIQTQIGELYQAECQMIEAIEAYRKSADYYQMDPNAKVREREIRLKMADIMCQEDHQNSYDCLKIYESIGFEQIKTPLTKSNGKILLIKAIYLELNYKDVPSTQELMNRYISEEPTLEDMVEYDFLLSAIESIKMENLQGFKLAVTKLNASNPLDKWRIVLLNKIQNKINGGFANQTENRQDVYLDSKGDMDLK